MVCLYRTRYRGFTARHFYEHLVRDHLCRWSYTWTKLLLQSKGLLERAPRRPLPGMMLHQAWLAGQAAMDLIVTMDDATSEIYSACLVEGEGAVSTFRALMEVFDAHGLPLSLCTDRIYRPRQSLFSYTRGRRYGRSPQPDPGRPGTGASGRRDIAPYAPEARGRSERMFRTLQDRLVKELALASITTVEAANAFIRDVHLAAYNARFTVKAEQDGSALVATPASI